MKQRYKEWQLIVIGEALSRLHEKGWFGGKPFPLKVGGGFPTLAEYRPHVRRLHRITGEEFQAEMVKWHYERLKNEGKNFLWVDSIDVIDWFEKNLSGEVVVTFDKDAVTRVWFEIEEDAKAFEAEFAEVMA